MAGRRTAEWRYPSAKQQRADDTSRRLADAQRQRQRAEAGDHEAWWAAVLADPRAETSRPDSSKRLYEIRSERLRVSCLHCRKVVDITRQEAIDRCGAQARWSEVGWRLLADACDYRGRRGDGCWPDFRT